MGQVGVLGAGIQGCCVALELARRGYHVDLLDRNDAPVMQASLQNEGKIHLGLVYANDPSLRTARRMLEGSLRFSSLLGRWCDLKDLHSRLSTPFYYAVHADSVLTPDQIAGHFKAVQDLHDDMRQGGAPAYLGLSGRSMFELVAGADNVFAAEKVTAAYRTMEYSVDPVWIAERLREAVLGNSRIKWHARTVVDSAARNDDGRVKVAFRESGTAGGESYDHVVNCLWDGRLKVDESIGVRPAGEWLYRFKAAVTLDLARTRDDLASVTIVLGAFGDVVNFVAAGKVYLSWYPCCMRAMVGHPPPEDWQPEAEVIGADGVAREALAALIEVHPGLGAVADENVRAEKVGGGIICARGRTDITDHASGLHRRFDIGVQSYGNYHSVDTGKYCMAPYFAEQVGRRIAGEV